MNTSQSGVTDQILGFYSAGLHRMRARFRNIKERLTWSDSGDRADVRFGSGADIVTLGPHPERRRRI